MVVEKIRSSAACLSLFGCLKRSFKENEKGGNLVIFSRYELTLKVECYRLFGCCFLFLLLLLLFFLFVGFLCDFLFFVEMYQTDYAVKSYIFTVV